MKRRPSAEEIGRLYDELGAALFRYALMILADREAAADALQQVFLALMSRTESPAEAGPYIWRAVRNECFTTLRRQQRAGMAVAQTFRSARLLEPVGEDDPELRLTLEQAIRSLPADQREVIHLKVFEGRTFQEIADVTAESINTIASRYRYAIEKLRAQLMIRS